MHHYRRRSVEPSSQDGKSFGSEHAELDKPVYTFLFSTHSGRDSLLARPRSSILEVGSQNRINRCNTGPPALISGKQPRPSCKTAACGTVCVPTDDIVLRIQHPQRAQEASHHVNRSRRPSEFHFVGVIRVAARISRPKPRAQSGLVQNWERRMSSQPQEVPRALPAPAPSRRPAQRTTSAGAEAIQVYVCVYVCVCACESVVP